MKIQDQLTQAIAEAAKSVLSKKESLKDYKPTRGGSKQDDFIDLHTINVEEGNEFTKAAAEAKLAGKEEFEFEGKTYPVEIGQEAAEKILGKNESVEELEEAVDNFFGFPTKDKLVKFQSIAKKLKIKPISNPTVLKRGGKEFHVMGFEGSVSDIEKAMKVASGIIKESEEIESQKKTKDLEEAIDPRKFALGGNTKATKRDVDAILSKIFMNAKLAKQVEDSEAYKAGYKSKGKGKNPYKKDTADFHLYILGQQSAQSE